MFDLLGIDWGEKNCGLALADSSTGLTLPLEGSSNAMLLNIITKLLEKYSTISKVIVGIPTNFKGQETILTTKIKEFVSILKSKLAPKIQIITVNERGSSKPFQIDQKLQKKQLIDSLSAAQILKFYLKLESHA